MSIDESIALLSAPTTWCRGAAELAKLDDTRAIVPLLEAYGSRHEGGKGCLIDALKKLATPERVNDLWKTPAHRPRLLVGMYLAPSPDYLPLIESAATDPDAKVRLQARRALSNWKNTPEWRAVMLKLLASDDVEARRCAVDGLSGIKKPEVMEAMQKQLAVETDASLKQALQRAVQ